ncbi:putative DNA binding domain-containing protein [Stenotrophomonas maltophilia]|nr:putative DNA binding domain-containing protein [Stenotrophomonas maltophilia]MBH1601653.1 putative DNA binding domain-containing protein [Stenotrophomonas maltophilia]
MAALLQVREEISRLIEFSSVGDEVLMALRQCPATLVPRECELWDYKQLLGESRLDQAELVRDVIAFHNSYGGYLLFGVDDDGVIRGADPVDGRQVRQWIRNYTAFDVEVSSFEISHDNGSISILHIPKREYGQVPLAVSKNGPELGNKKPIFKAGEIFFRASDSTQLIRGTDDLRFLLGARDQVFSGGADRFGGPVVSNNLPDRSVIFDKFIGRAGVKETLWSWLADPMSRYRVLAGPGGVGKTSAAYSFCEEVCMQGPLRLEQVVWLSAKKRQFVAQSNNHKPLPYKEDSREFGESYANFDGLLDALSFHLAISDDEWDGADRGFRSRLIANCLSVLPSLVVVDDLDSLPPDDQRLAVELAMSLGASKSRFLFTTRKNYLAPLSSTTELKGLEGDEFENYVLHLQETYQRVLNSSEKKDLAKDTEGSPLFVESVFRLLKLGERFGEALARWRGADGEAVRAASFRRELEQLSWGAKKVLFAMSLFDTVSTVEVRKLAELELSEVEAGIVELDRLFLVQSRQIADIARFSVAANLKRMLQDLKVELIPNHADVTRRAATLRSQGKSEQAGGKNRAVASVIRQAMAQLSVGEAKGACTTLESVIAEFRESADIWMVYARCLAACTPCDSSKARSAFQKSFDLGKRDPQLFLKWISFEIEQGQANAAVDVAEKGRRVMDGAADGWSWLERRAAAHFRRGQERERRREHTDAMTDLRAASELASKALRRAPASTRPQLVQLAQQYNDSVWAISTGPSLFSIPDRFEAANLAVKNGDRRDLCLVRVLQSIEFGFNEPYFKSKQAKRLGEWIEIISPIVSARGSSAAKELLASLVGRLDS